MVGSAVVAATAQPHFSVARLVLAVTLGSRRLARRVVVVAGLVAARVVRVLVGEPVRRVPHLVDRDLGGAAGQRVGADRPAAAAVDGGVDDDERDRELRHLRGCDLQRRGVVADQQPADAVAAEGRVEVGSRRRAGAAAAIRDRRRRSRSSAR